MAAATLPVEPHLLAYATNTRRGWGWFSPQLVSKKAKVDAQLCAGINRLDPVNSAHIPPPAR
jgi:hypothetical protein